METTHASDAAIVDALRNGENWAFQQLIDQHQGLMLRVAGSYVSTPAVAQEVVQDTWLSVFRGIRSFEARSTLKTWIFRILVNRAKSRGAGESRCVPFSSLVAGDADRGIAEADVLIHRARISPSESRSPEERLISREMIDHAITAMGELPNSQRQVIAMRDLQGCSSDEVCSALGISGGNQRVQLHRARASVKRELDRYLSAEQFVAA